MKKQTHSTLLPVVAATAGIGLLPILFCPAIDHKKVGSHPKPTVVSILAGYKSWTRVNPTPFRMDSFVTKTQMKSARYQALSELCAQSAETMAEMRSMGTPTGPHTEKYITVYVNAVGKAAMMEQRSPHFPVGTVIVKEKLSRPDGKSPEFMTVMVKHEKGYNPASGDWEYLAIDGTGTQIQAQGKLEKCQTCHQEVEETDYVFRSYLPYDALRKLK